MGKEVFVDANVFLEVFFDDSKAGECEKFLESLNINEDIMLTSDFLIYSCLIAIENKFKDNKKLENALIFFSSLSNLRILIPSFDEYHRLYGLDHEKVKLAKKDVKILHPGPMNRGVEITSELADDEKYSFINKQVSNGVAIRMALLYLLIFASK